MVNSTATAAARRQFDRAMAVMDDDSDASRRYFQEATDIDPSMADAWLGRVAMGDNSLITLQQLFARGSRLRRESNRLGASLSAPIKAGPYLSITVTDCSHAGIALASAFIDAERFPEAESLLEQPTLLEDWENHQWHQHLRAYLMFATQRWPDVINEVARTLPPQAIISSAVTAASCALAAHAATHLGQGRAAVDWTEAAHIDPVDFPLIAADLAYIRGMAYRQLGDEDAAHLSLTKATINRVLIGPAKEALADQRLQLVVTDESSIDSRTDRWDATTEQSEQVRSEAAHREKRAELLAEGRALLDSQVGLIEVKRAVAELEDQIEVRALRLEHGLPVASQTNHMLLVGPPGTGKTTTAEALGKIYAGLGIVRHPEIVEVKRSDFCGEHIGSSGPKTNELINRSLGRILFMDEFYSLVERHHDGRPDMIGMEAVNQLLIALETHRFDFCFIGAGYEREIDEFLAVNPGLGGRFNRKLRFESYSPDELVEIAARYGGPRATVLAPDARSAFEVACHRIRDHVSPNGSHGIDVMQNGRFARNVVERAERLRDSRVAAQNRASQGSVTIEDLETLSESDIIGAVTEACAEKHVPVGL